MTISRTFAVIISVCLLFPTLVHSKVGNRPDTPLVVIVTTDNDYLEVQALPGFVPENSKHMNQVHELGEFGCKLYDRVAVILSESTSDKWYPVKIDGKDEAIYQKTFLFACAMP